MAKRLSKKEKIAIDKSFIAGKTVDELAEEFDCAKTTIIRNLKINLGEEKFKELSKIIKKNNQEKNIFDGKKNSLDNESNNFDVASNVQENELITFTPFTEIVPLNYEMDDTTQKDLTSVPINDVDFPKIVYILVDKNIELETKLLKEFPAWQFLSKQDLNRKTIEVYFDLKNAKRFCTKDQKVIKVPNPEVFKIAASLLINRGISRIVCPDKLISL